MPAEAEGTRVLLIGNQLTPGSAINGTGTLFAETVRQLERRGFNLTVLNLSRPVNGQQKGRHSDRMPSRATPLLYLIKRIIMNMALLAHLVWGSLRHIRRSEVIFLNTGFSPVYVIVTIYVWLMAKVTRRPLALWYLGGELSRLSRYGPLFRWLVDRTFLRSPLVYAETRQTLRELGCSANVRWLPNTRDIEPPAEKRRGEVRKLVFAARLRTDKGLAESLEACRSLPEGCHLQVFGCVQPATDLSLFEGHPRASYGGALEPEEMIRTLSEQDLLLYPSYSRGEGIPGVIVEAFQCGVPVITTRWGDIPGLVQHEENGLFVEPRSADSLKAAIHRLLDDPDLYRRLCAGAQKQGEAFRSGPWYDEVARDLRALCGR